MIASTQIRNIDIFRIFGYLIFRFLSQKVLRIIGLDNRDREKVGYFLRR